MNGIVLTMTNNFRFIDFSDEAFLKIWTVDVIANLFYSFYPAVLILLIESQNVTFRRLAKYCSRQRPKVPILAYLIALIPISAVVSVCAYYLRSDNVTTGIILKSLALFSMIFIGMLIFSPGATFRWKTKCLDYESEEYLIKRHSKHQFSQLLFGYWFTMHYEVTQKVVFLIAYTGEPIRTFVCAASAYFILAISNLLDTKTLARQSSQLSIQIISAMGIILWGLAPFLLLSRIASS